MAFVAIKQNATDEQEYKTSATKLNGIAHAYFTILGCEGALLTVNASSQVITSTMGLNQELLLRQKVSRTNVVSNEQINLKDFSRVSKDLKNF